jgi:hypothetical protein
MKLLGLSLHAVCDNLAFLRFQWRCPTHDVIKGSESDGSSAVKALVMGPAQVDMNKYNLP